MNPYLAKLRARDEIHHPQGPSKPSKPILSVVNHANTTGGTGFEGFEGDLSRRPSENETVAGGNRLDPYGPLGQTYAALAAGCPEHVLADRWQQALQDGRRFLASTSRPTSRTRLIVAYPGTTRPGSSGSWAGGRWWRSRPPPLRSRTPPGPSPSIAGMPNRHLARSATAWTTFNDRS